MTSTRYLVVAGQKSSGTSDKQRSLLAEIRRLTEARGYSPTRRELANATGTHINNVQQMLFRLRRDGALTFDDGVARSIRIVESPDA